MKPHVFDMFIQRKTQINQEISQITKDEIICLADCAFIFPIIRFRIARANKITSR